jgi:hypothetical protein
MSELPGWVVDDVTSVRREVAEWRNLTVQQRWTLARQCARDAIWAIRAGGHPDRVLGHTDPLPESSVAALARLRQEAGWGRGVR